VGFAACRTIWGDIDSAFLGEHGTPQIADFDADGTLDVAVSSNEANTVWLFRDFGGGTGDVLASSADVTITGTGNPSELGIGLSSGDVDADGIPDLLVGASDGGAPQAIRAPRTCSSGLPWARWRPATRTSPSPGYGRRAACVAAADLDGDDRTTSCPSRRASTIRAGSDRVS
jgi:hypothetical protein